MKKIPLAIAVLAVILSGFSLYKSKSDSQLVYVEVNKLIDGYKRSKTTKAEFDKKANAAKANVDSLMLGWQNELKAYERERASFSPKELALRRELMSSKQQQINAYREGIQKQLLDENRKTTQTVVNDINDYVKEFGKKKGYKIIFGASGGGNIMYADESTDLTEEVLKGLNEEYDKK